MNPNSKSEQPEQAPPAAAVVRMSPIYRMRIPGYRVYEEPQTMHIDLSKIVSISGPRLVTIGRYETEIQLEMVVQLLASPVVVAVLQPMTVNTRPGNAYDYVVVTDPETEMPSRMSEMNSLAEQLLDAWRQHTEENA